MCWEKINHVPHTVCIDSCVSLIRCCCCHYDDVIMGAMASQITSLTIVYSTVYSGAHQSKHQSSANALELRLSCTNPSKWIIPQMSVFIVFTKVTQQRLLINKTLRFIHAVRYTWFIFSQHIKMCCETYDKLRQRDESNKKCRIRRLTWILHVKRPTYERIKWRRRIRRRTLID